MFSQTTEYALRAMVVLGTRSDGLTSTSELAAQTRVPANYLAKVLQNLASADLIIGRRGVGGGYRLARPPAEIRLIDVVRAVGRLDRIETCPVAGDGGRGSLCRLHGMMDDVVHSAERILEGHRLSDLLEPRDGTPPLCAARMPAAAVADGQPAPVRGEPGMI